MTTERGGTAGAIFQFTERSEIAVIWTMPLDAKTEWMAMVYRDDAAADWIAKFRFRYRVDELVWGSEDRKSVYEMRPTTDGATTAARDRLIQAMDLAAGKLAEASGHQPDRYEIFGDAEQMNRALSGKAGMHSMSSGPQN